MGLGYLNCFFLTAVFLCFRCKWFFDIVDDVLQTDRFLEEGNQVKFLYPRTDHWNIFERRDFSLNLRKNVFETLKLNAKTFAVFVHQWDKEVELILLEVGPKDFCGFFKGEGVLSKFLDTVWREVLPEEASREELWLKMVSKWAFHDFGGKSNIEII